MPHEIETASGSAALVEQLLRKLLRGETSIKEVSGLLSLSSVEQLVSAPASEKEASPPNRSVEDQTTSHIPGAAIDLARETRCGFPEVVYGPGKPSELVVRIFARLLEAGQSCLATRLSAEQTTALREAYPAAVLNEVAATARIDSPIPPPLAGRVTVVTAGSADRPVAEEAIETLRWMRCHVDLIDDIGVAGPQRLLARVPDLRQADALVVAAGMEGALPSVVAGHVRCPIFAVPTSTGYGTSFGGVSALLSMLNSCASNVAVVNIDAGFRAAYLAGMVARRVTS
jgi:NCAIR mutase (PurE)-related protein